MNEWVNERMNDVSYHTCSTVTLNRRWLDFHEFITNTDQNSTWEKASWIWENKHATGKRNKHARCKNYIIYVLPQIM